MGKASDLMEKRTLIGILTPSSNTVLEPLTSAMVGTLNNVSAHFGRFRVTEISTSEKSKAQFTLDPQLAAAELLADAQVNAIVWSGTSASWLGFEKDRELCAAIEQRTGIVAGSAVLAINELFEASGVRTFGLVTPYESSIQEQIIDNYAQSNFNCIAEKHLNEINNFSFSTFSEDTVENAIREVARSSPDAITIMCTNMWGARKAHELEQELNIPIFDSTAAALWTGMHLSGDDPNRIRGWGKLFSY